MGEIKSTLQLVMERTRHLTLSDEEKSRQQRQEAGRRAHGLLQRYLDGLMDIQQTIKQAASLSNSPLFKASDLLEQAIWEKISLDEVDAAGHLLDLLDRCNAPKAQTARALYTDWCRDLKRLEQEFGRRQLDDLARLAGISGSAVVPNPVAHSQWPQQVARLRESYARRLDDLRPAMLAPSADKSC